MSLIIARFLIDNSPNTKVFFETPDVEWILRRQVIWDFFYEHCSYFSANSLTTLFQRAGFKVDGVKHVFRGQYLWLEASLTDETTQLYSKSGHILKLASDFGQMETQLIRIWREKLNDWQKGEKVCLPS